MVLAELHPGAAWIRPVTLDSALEQDLGLDSLSRVELAARIERAFAATLPEHTLGGAAPAGRNVRHRTDGEEEGIHPVIGSQGRLHSMSLVLCRIDSPSASDRQGMLAKPAHMLDVTSANNREWWRKT